MAAIYKITRRHNPWAAHQRCLDNSFAFFSFSKLIFSKTNKSSSTISSSKKIIILIKILIICDGVRENYLHLPVFSGMTKNVS